MSAQLYARTVNVAWNYEVEPNVDIILSKATREAWRFLRIASAVQLRHV